MYYDLVASLPFLPYFERADRLPITRLRLDQRLRLLKPAHAEQLARAHSLVRWRPDRLLGTADAAQVKEYAAVMASPLDRPLREYVAFRMSQQTLVAALRRKREGSASLDGTAWGAGPWVRHVQRHWDEPDFRLARVVPWLLQARDLLAASDARGLERLLMDVAWRWLDRCAQQNTFSFEAVFSYFFKWDILRAWLACDANKGKTRFRDLIDKVTHVEQS
ncbi:MAG: DUF2764 domain-containing protein [Thermoguttaceae bacterium]|nr:DUF2764 domain-containing protein [Thermoguttaceae bacterium]